MFGNVRTVTNVLIVTDADWIRDEVDAALNGVGMSIARIASGKDAVPTIRELKPSIVFVDMQIGNMGGMAVCKEIRHQEQSGTIDETGVILLLDREADLWLARQVDPDGLLVKPLDALAIRSAFEAVSAGGTYLATPTGV